MWSLYFLTFARDIYKPIYSNKYSKNWNPKTKNQIDQKRDICHPKFPITSVGDDGIFRQKTPFLFSFFSLLNKWLEDKLRNKKRLNMQNIGGTSPDMHLNLNIRDLAKKFILWERHNIFKHGSIKLRKTHQFPMKLILF